MFKNMKVRSKLLVSFGIVIVLSIMLTMFSVFALQSTVNSYEDLSALSDERVQVILTVKDEVTNIRRIAAMINAYCGDTDRQQGYKPESADAVARIYNNADKYIELVYQDDSLGDNLKRELASKAESLKAITAQYKSDLIDQNIEYGLIDDKESLLANSGTQAPLISTIQGTIVELTETEHELHAQQDIQTDRAKNTAAVYRIIFIVFAAFITAVTFALAINISGVIAAPLRTLEEWYAMTAKGDIVFKPDELAVFDVYGKRKDEIGGLYSAYKEQIDDLNATCGYLDRISSGDFNLTLTPRSEYDLFRHSMSKMIDNLNGSFARISSSTNQVSSSSQQIAGGAQSLAQGSTMQAASVQELSSAIHEIAEKTGTNAEMADKAAKLAVKIKDNAEEGNRHMSSMTAAVKEINEASQQIGKVIKTIDDIAFQTNILALNAAVEAARAGAAGKGFAVVAEEVRNLASKSAEAAKDTASLIANSMEKAELGTRIASETAESLAQIVMGINESGQLIDEIASLSQEQSMSISQINTGIDQVSQVIQQNSATAQESAAVAEQMSGQSSMLGDLLSQFTFR